MSGRIPDAFIQDLLARTDLVELISARVELKRAGREFKGLSPFTNEKSPSFFVSPAKQMFFDFSSGKNGNAVGFLMEYDRLSFVEAVEELARRAGLEVPREGGGQAQVVMDGPLDALAAAQRFYREQLRSAQPAIDYLKRRGVSGDTARRFGIGYAPESWDALSRFLKDTRHAVDAGLLIERDGGGVYDRFRNRIMFPIHDTRGRVIAFGGRTLGNDPAKYLNSPETPLFHKGRQLFGLYEARQAAKSALPYLIVVEGYMDVVMLHQHGLSEAVATLGTATTREHLHLLFKTSPRIVFCFDGDRAGRSAAWRALEQALPEVSEGRECVFMFLPEGQDPDSLVQAIGAEAFRGLIAQAQTLSQFLLGELARQVNLGTMDGRAKLAGLARPYLEKMREGPLRSLILDELARLTRLRREDVLSAAPSRPARAESRAPARAEPASARPVKRALQILLEKPALAEQAGNLALLAQSDAPGVHLLVEVLDYFQAHPDHRAAQLLNSWGESPRTAALARLMEERLTLEEAELDNEFRDSLAHLAQKGLRARVEQLLAEARLRPLTEAETREIAAVTRELAHK